MKLLFIEASPRKEHSSSSRVAKAFVEGYQKTKFCAQERLGCCLQATVAGSAYAG